MWRAASSLGAIPMLPAPLQFIIAMVAYAINKGMARRVDYLREEVLVLKEALSVATGKTRIDLSANQRRRLALKGKELTAEERTACCQIVRRETILARTVQKPIAADSRMIRRQTAGLKMWRATSRLGAITMPVASRRTAQLLPPRPACGAATAFRTSRGRPSREGEPLRRPAAIQAVSSLLPAAPPRFRRVA